MQFGVARLPRTVRPNHQLDGGLIAKCRLLYAVHELGFRRRTLMWRGRARLARGPTHETARGAST